MPRRPPVAARSPLAVALLALTAACSGSSPATGNDAVPVPSVNGLSATSLLRCRTLQGALPEQLGSGVSRRPVTPVSDTTVAWGDPPITLRCGVEEGSGRDEPYTFNEVRWALHDTGASRTWTTVGRPVNVAVEVPDAYSSQAELVGSVSFAVARTLG